MPQHDRFRMLHVGCARRMFRRWNLCAWQGPARQHCPALAVLTGEGPLLPGQPLPEVRGSGRRTLGSLPRLPSFVPGGDLVPLIRAPQGFGRIDRWEVSSVLGPVGSGVSW